MEPNQKIDEGLIFELEPSSITVNTDLPRQRRELGEIEALMQSISANGQIQPIVINRNNELIAGGRRLAACLMLGIKVRTCYKDTLDHVTMREIELEENLQRKDLTPAEKAFAIDELVKLKQGKLGKATTSPTNTGVSLDDIAAMIGKSRGTVSEAMQIAEAVRAFPNLAEAKTASEIKSAYKGLQRTQQTMDALVSYEETIKRSKEFVLVQRDAVEYLKGLGDNSIDLFFTDPPYGIDIHNLAMTTGGKTGGELTTTGTTYNDSEGYAKTLLERFAVESYRITKDTGHAYIFCAPSHFAWLSERMASAGWLVAPRPVVWIKRESGQNNQPEKWFSAGYEFILFARKPSSCLILQGRLDWLQCDPVLPSVRIHQAEKPVALCKELISRCCMPGGYLVDPCMGSGAIIQAGVEMKVLSLGCEKEQSTYALAVARMAELNKPLNSVKI